MNVIVFQKLMNLTFPSYMCRTLPRFFLAHQERQLMLQEEGISIWENEKKLISTELNDFSRGAFH